MKRFCTLLSAGLLPFAAGFFYEWTMPLWPLSYPGFNMLFLVLWGVLHCTVYRRGENLAVYLLCTHGIPLLCLGLVLVQELLLDGFWLNWVGWATQISFFPVVSLGMLVTSLLLSGFYTVWLGALVGFILMILFALAACLLKRLPKAKP